MRNVPEFVIPNIASIYTKNNYEALSSR